MSIAISETTTVDVDRPETWPEATSEWAMRRATELAGTAQCTPDLPGLDECEDGFRLTFGDARLLAYHCTRLLAHETETIRTEGCWTRL
ncbi:MAG TPA: hypothetical protein VFF79_14095 [Conexibacter sp.]|jgi:hypothetical protein|nr:hypothetical protein [Conexibacter sp.]